jgi:hypothetical protein
MSSDFLIHFAVQANAEAAQFSSMKRKYLAMTIDCKKGENFEIQLNDLGGEGT